MRRTTAIIVLGCKVHEDGAPSSLLAGRIAWGAAAYAAHLGDLVIAAGGRRWGAHREADVIARGLEERGVPRDRILPERGSMTTAENAVNASDVMARHGVARAYVVTCDFHIARALACFRALGVPASGVGAPTGYLDVRTRLRLRAHERFARYFDASHLASVVEARTVLGHAFGASDGRADEPRVPAARVGVGLRR